MCHAAHSVRSGQHQLDAAYTCRAQFLVYQSWPAGGLVAQSQHSLPCSQWAELCSDDGLQAFTN